MIGLRRCAFRLTVAVAIAIVTGCSGAPKRDMLRAVLLSPEQATTKRLRAARDDGATAAVLAIDGVTTEARRREVAAAGRILDAGLTLHYWVEIARCEALADAHPRWMASLQGHTEWRRLFDDPPAARDGEVVKAHPWVPILYAEAFDAQLARVGTLLDDRPAARAILLNDLQGAPSACGCGNTLCRWTTDYGPIRTATLLGDDAAARFVSAVRELTPRSEVVPVWTTECDAKDKPTHCAGVGCFQGICWKAYAKQLAPLAASAGRLGVLVPFRAFERELAWPARALATFQEILPRHGMPAVPAGRLIAVLQGWDVTPEEIAAQVKLVEEAGAAGYVVALDPIAQGWQPRIFSLVQR